MALPARHTHFLTVALRSHVLISPARMKSLIDLAISTEIARAHLESPVRDITIHEISYEGSLPVDVH